MTRLFRGLLLSALALAMLCTAVPAHAGAIVPAAFDGNTLAANDDFYTGLVGIGFTVNFFGTDYSQLYVNNNGNVTFDGPLGTYTPFDIVTTGVRIIAPFFGDVDTSSAGDEVTYGTGTFDGRDAFGVNWVNVDYYSSSPTHTNRNSFQLIMVERFDTGTGNFDFIFNYDLIQWEAGTASSSDAQGCGGFPARVGFSNGGSTSFELAGSGVGGAFIDSGTCVDGAPYAGAGPNALIAHSLNSNIDGRYVFTVRNGEVTNTPTAVPEPASLLLLGSGLALVGYRARSRKAKS